MHARFLSISYPYSWFKDKPANKEADKMPVSEPVSEISHPDMLPNNLKAGNIAWVRYEETHSVAITTQTVDPIFGRPRMK
jgi:hypothetical protein